MHPMGWGRDPPYMQDKARNPCLWGPGGRTRSKPLLDQRHAVTGARQLHLDARQRAALAAELGRHGTGLTGPAQGLPAGREPAAAWGGGQSRRWGTRPRAHKGGNEIGAAQQGVGSRPHKQGGGAASPPCPGAPGTSSSFQSSLFSSRFLPGHGPESPTTPLHPHSPHHPHPHPNPSVPPSSPTCG